MARGGGRHPGLGGARRQAARLRTAKGRSASSQRWLRRQLNDPYVAEAKRRGYRSRAAFKLLEIDDRFRLLRPGAVVVDLGAAPGGWTQIAAERVKPGAGQGGRAGRVLACDLLAMDAIPGAEILCADMVTDSGLALLHRALPDGADLVLSDMAAPATGHASTDHLRTVALCEAAFDFAESVLRPGGAFVAKVFRGGTEAGLLGRLKAGFAAVRHVKPAASRPQSPEVYVVATGFRAAAARV